MISIKNLSKEYFIKKNVINRVIDNLSIIFDKGDNVKILGPSGSGKSTLINLISGMDSPSEGNVIIENISLNNLKEDEISDLRKTKIGIIFQTPSLHPNLNVMENIELPLVFNEIKKSERIQKIQKMIDLLKLNDRKMHYPNDLSGGEKQKVAIARALVIDPVIILADEPTGNLDFESGKEVINILNSVKTKKTTLIIVTHDSNILKEGDRVIYLEDGIIKRDKRI